MPNSVGGLASGLNTTDIINAMLQSEGVTRARLQTRQSDYQRQLSVWQDLSSKLGSLKTAADAFSSPTKAMGAAATSSDEDLVIATASAGAAPSAFSFRVQQLATSHQRIANGFTTTTDLVGAGKANVASGLTGVGLTLTNGAALVGGKYDIEVRSISGGTATVSFAGFEQTVSTTGPITLTDGNGHSATFTAALKTGKASVGVIETTATTTLSDLATAINTLGAGVSAAAVDKNDGTATPTSFVLSAREAGTGHAVTADFSGLSGMAGKAFADLRAAGDAQILLADGLTTVTRSTNRISDLIPGVTLDLRSADPSKDVTVDVAQDDQKVVDAGKAVVDALNSVLAAVKKSTNIDPNNKTASTLSGDSRMRRVTDSLFEAMRYSDDGQDKQVLSQVGITLGRDGTYSLDESKFRAALANDYSGTVRLLAGDGASRKGVFATVTDAVKNMVENQGTVNGAIDATQSNIRSLDSRIATEDQRLALVENRIRRQYTNLESTLAQLSSQASGLTNALG